MVIIENTQNAMSNEIFYKWSFIVSVIALVVVSGYSIATANYISTLLK